MSHQAMHKGTPHLSTPRRQPVVAAPLPRRACRPSPCKLRAVDPSLPPRRNGSTPKQPQQQQQQQQDQDDPVAAMLWAAQQQDGLQVVFEEGDEEAEELDDIMEDLEDPWMRNPSPPEWSELPLFAAPDATGGSSTPSSPAAAGVQDPTPPSSPQFATVKWQQLEQLVLQQQQQQQQQRLVVLEVACPDGQPLQEQQPPCRPLPEPLPWLSSSSTAGSMQQQQQGSLQGGQVQVVRLELPALTREVAAQWQGQGAVVAVWDSGHHGCLAAAIRLSAVYRLPQVVLLQEL